MITFTIKKLGAKKPILENQIITLDLPDKPLTLEKLITVLVKQQVDKYNQQQQTDNILQLLTEKEIESGLKVGKVGFGKQIDAKIQNKPILQAYDSALSNALTAFKDGIFCVFVDGQQFESLDEKIELRDGSEINFIRLTMLTGQR